MKSFIYIKDSKFMTSAQFVLMPAYAFCHPPPRQLIENSIIISKGSDDDAAAKSPYQLEPGRAGRLRAIGSLKGSPERCAGES
jgi:hypothetical protein